MKAKLAQVWQWVCPACGHINTDPNVPYEASVEERTDLKLALGIDLFADGEFLAVPSCVTCVSCEEDFDTVTDEGTR